MLADGCEAYVRSQNPETDEELRGLIKDMVDRRVETGQLNQTEITLKDLVTIIDSFTATLKGTYHARVEYPEDEDEQEQDEIQPDVGSNDETLIEKREE
jgi:membrane-associated HD superfamily phosphohydrolase